MLGFAKLGEVDTFVQQSKLYLRLYRARSFVIILYQTSATEHHFNIILSLIPVPLKMFSFFFKSKRLYAFLVLSRSLRILSTSDFPKLRPRETLVFCEQGLGLSSRNRVMEIFPNSQENVVSLITLTQFYIVSQALIYFYCNNDTI